MAIDLSIAAEICEKLATSAHGLGSVLRSDQRFPSRSEFYRWLESDGQDGDALRDMYARGKAAQADYMAEQILEIADDGRNDVWHDPETGKPVVDFDHIQRSRLRVDARKWIAAKLAPRKYGEKTQLEHSGPDGRPVSHSLTVEFVDPSE